MITFKDFLTESRSAPLYHGTTMYSLFDILQSGSIAAQTLQAFTGAQGSYKVLNGISLSRNYRFTLMWAISKSGDAPVVFHLDQRKLTQNFKVVPYQYWRNQTRRQEISSSTIDNEYEEFVISSKGKPINISRYVTQIDYSDPLTNADKLKTLMQKYPNIKFNRI